MTLLEMIIHCKDDEVDGIIKKALIEINRNCESGKMLGFVNNRKLISVHKGFIPFDTRIKYSSMGVETYSMKTDDYFYEFALFLRKFKITTSASFINYMEIFIQQYFGMNSDGVDRRSMIFNDIAWNTTTTDEEYFQRIENNEIGDLKGKNVAMCSEISAIAQNLLSLFGVESYYCVGCVNDNGKEEGHCFNIVRAKTMFKLLDYSLVVPSYSAGKLCCYFPFQGNIDFSKVDDILFNGECIDFETYYYVYEQDNRRYKTIMENNKRTYVVGDISLENNKKK